MDDTPATVYLETYGCQMNVLDSTLVQEQLEALGYRMVTAADEAGIVLMNTCSIRELSEQKVWSFLGRLAITKRRREDLIVGVLGCMAEREGPAILRRMPHVDVVCGPSNLAQLPLLLHNARTQRQVQVALSGHTSRRTSTMDAAAEQDLEALDVGRATGPTAHDGRRPATQAYVRITRGCNKFCSYCVVPYTRGPEAHRPPQHILAEVRRLVAGGAREVTLLGQTINHYSHHDGGHTTSFADLLALVHEGVPDLARLRFITSYPRDFTDDALDVMAGCRRICRFLHIPAQSGSNAVLRRMNRGYTVETYLDLLQRARARMPDLRLAGDMIAGFCGETDADHEASVQLLRAARYKSCFIFKYSPRSGTVAQRRLPDDVDEGVKRARNAELLAVQAEISLAHNAAHIGSSVQVLTEHVSRLKSTPTPAPSAAGAASGLVTLGARGRPQPVGEGGGRVPDAGLVRLIGRTEGDELVAFDGPAAWVGRMVDVEIRGASAVTLRGVAQGAVDGAAGPAVSPDSAAPAALESA